MFAATGAILLAANLIDGIAVTSFWPSAVIAAIVLGVLSLVIKPIISFFSFPITILTLGLFTFVINALIFWMLTFLEGISINGFVPTLLGSLFVSIAVWLVDSFVD